MARTGFWKPPIFLSLHSKLDLFGLDWMSLRRYAVGFRELISSLSTDYTGISVSCFRQVTESTTIENTAKEALNTSNEAHRIAQEAVQKPGEVSSEIEIVTRRYFILMLRPLIYAIVGKLCATFSEPLK